MTQEKFFGFEVKPPMSIEGYLKKQKIMETTYCLYDGRYRTDADRAVLYEACDTLKEAMKNAKEYGDDTVIVKERLKKVQEGIYEVLGREIIN